MRQLRLMRDYTHEHRCHCFRIRSRYVSPAGVFQIALARTGSALRLVKELVHRIRKGWDAAPRAAASPGIHQREMPRSFRGRCRADPPYGRRSSGQEASREIQNGDAGA